MDYAFLTLLSSTSIKSSEWGGSLLIGDNLSLPGIGVAIFAACIFVLHLIGL
jgi:hypothetical protein